jgi:hypothetical protein
MRHQYALISVFVGICLEWSPLGAQAETAVPTVTLDRAIHFTAPNGSDLLVAADTYQVEQATGTNIRLVTEASPTTHEISGTSFTHEESLTAPLALTLREKERDDSAHLLLLLPDGTGLDAAGRLGNVQTRGGEFRVPSQRQYTGMVIENKEKTLQSQNEEIDAQKKEAGQRFDDAMNRATIEMRTGIAPTGTAMRLQRCDVCKVLQTR